MASPEGSTTIIISKLCYVLRGVLVNTESDQEFSKCAVFHSSLCVASYLFVFAKSLVQLVEYLSCPLNIEVVCQKVVTLVYLASCLSAVVSNVLGRGDINRFFRETLDLQRIISDNKLHPRANRKNKVIRILIFTIIVVAAITDEYETVKFLLKTDELSFRRSVLDAVFTVLRLCTIPFAWFTCYSASVAYLLRFELAEVIVEGTVVQDNLKVFSIPLSPALPPSLVLSEEEISRPCRGSAGIKSRYHRMRIMLSKKKKFVFGMNQRLYYQLAWLMLLNVCYIPVVAFQGVAGNSDTPALLDGLSKYSAILSFFVCSLVPIAITHWVRCRLSRLVGTLFSKAYAAKDPSAMKMLVRFIHSTRDDYPHSPCVLFYFDPSFLLVLQDTVVLMTTTLLVSN